MDRRYRKKMNAHWARAETKARRTVDSLDLSSWFDNWHTHVDWHGKGNSCQENRADVAAATVRLLQHIEHRATGRREPIQLWAMLFGDTRYNAVYAHSKNPNGTPFPHSFGDVAWGKLAPDWMTAAVPDDTYEIGTASDADEVVYLIRRRA